MNDIMVKGTKMTQQSHYPIGTPGQKWGDTEKQQWREQQSVKRSYQQQVIDKLDQCQHFDVKQYGSLPQDNDKYTF